MQICRFNETRLGLIEGDRVYDVTETVSTLGVHWPIPFGDPLIAHLDELMPRLQTARASAASYRADQVRLFSPVSWPPKIIAAPGNYALHVAQDLMDPGVDQGVHRNSVSGVERPVDKLGLFLKASSSIVGPAEGIEIDWPDRRVDHEIELVVVIGRKAKHVPRARAFEYVAGYTLGLDMTVRGAEDRSFRKSPDSFTVIGPAFVSRDEIDDPANLIIWLEVNGQLRQKSSTSSMTVGIAELIEIASRVYTLHPGDIIMTGTPEGVGPVVPGDVLRVGGTGLGEMSIVVRRSGDFPVHARASAQLP